MYLITVNNTIQSYFKKGITRSIVEKEVKSLQNRSLHECEEAIKKGIQLDWDQTVAGQIFIKLTDDPYFPFENLKNADWIQLVEKINSNPAKRMQFLENVLLPQIQLFAQKICANSLHSAGFFTKLMAFTGTLWNKHSLDIRLQAIPEFGIDEKTDLAVKASAVTVGLIGTTEETLKSFAHINYDVIIDTGGELRREEDPVQLARKLAKINERSAAFYNSLGEQSVTDGQSEMLLSESLLSPDKRVTILEMRFSTGADIKYKPTAHGVITIGRNTLWRDLKQGIWRLRGIDRGQTLTFFVSHDVEMLVRSVAKKEGPLSYNDIKLFVQKNEIERIKQDNLTALREGFMAIPQHLLVLQMLQENQSPERYLKVSQLVEEFWIKKELIDPAKLFGQLSIPQQVQDFFYGESGVIAECKALLERIFVELTIDSLTQRSVSHSVSELDKTCSDYIQRKLLPAIIVKPVINSDMAMETHTEQQTQMQQDMKVEKVQVFEDPFTELGYIKAYSGLEKISVTTSEFPLNLGNYKLPYFSLTDYFSFNALKDYAEAFSDVLITSNVLVWSKDVMNPKIKDTLFFWPHRHLKHFIIRKHSNEVVILSEDDIQLEFEGEGDFKNPNKFLYLSSDYYHVDLGFCHDPDRPIGLELLRTIVKIKFLDGESRYTEKELDLLKSWISRHGVSKMLHLYEHALTVSPKRRAAFNGGSSLKHLFNQLDLEENKK